MFRVFRNQHRVDSLQFLGFPVFADCKGTTFILTLQKFLKIFVPPTFLNLLFFPERATKVEILRYSHKGVVKIFASIL